MDETLRREVRFLTTRLGAMVREQCGAKTFEAIETLRRLSKQIRLSSDPRLIESKERVVRGLTIERAADVAHAFSLFFHLVNLAEERQRVRRLTAYAHEDAGAPMSLRRTFNELRRNHVSPRRLARLLGSMRVVPVLTAHPTEAKRRSVFNHLLRIGRTLDRLSGELGPAAERAVDPWVEALWLTDEIRERALSPEVEIESALVFLERTIYDLAGTFWEKFHENCARFNPRLRLPSPFIAFGSWIGADRDGNPNVTPQTSLAAAESLRQSILEYYRSATRRLLGLLPFPSRRPALVRRLRQSLARDLVQFLTARPLTEIDQPSELYRKKARVMLWRLDQTLARSPGAYADPGEFSRDAGLLEEALASHSSPRVARLGPGRLRIAAEVFGFHAARLDFRQHVSVTRAAARELLAAEGLPAEPADARIRAIRRLLARPAPFNSRPKLSPATRTALAEFDCLKEIQGRFGGRAASPYILSMTSSAADLWDVLLLANAAGLISPDASGRLRSQLDLVPLFETVDALEAGPAILDEFFSDPLYRQILNSRRNFQEVMLGYSDSVKDSGYLAANVALFRAAKRLAKVAERHSVRFGLFHGKGGTIDRGGGQSYQSIRAQPEAAPGGRIRITEQGEVIALKYADPVIAERNLEQLVASVLAAHLLARPLRGTRLAQWESYAAEMAGSSREHYRALVYETPGFVSYFRQATPIDLIEQLRLGSRPTRRPSGEDSFKLEELRAIPWVFAWTQSRQFVPAWYGLGTALEKFATGSGRRGLDRLREMYRAWPFFAVLLDNAEISLAKTDLYIASRYAVRVRPKQLGETIFGRIQEEFRRSVRWVLDVSGSSHLLARQPVLAESIRLRNPYVDPLNFLQIRFLDEWRRPRLSQERRREVLHLLQITVGGIAFGMKSTG